MDLFMVLSMEIQMEIFTDHGYVNGYIHGYIGIYSWIYWVAQVPQLPWAAKVLGLPPKRCPCSETYPLRAVRVPELTPAAQVPNLTATSPPS